MYSTRNLSSARGRQFFFAGLAAVALVAGISFQAGTSSAAEDTGEATLQLSEQNGNVLVTIEGMAANAPVTIKGTVGQSSGQGSFTTTSAGGSVIAFAPDPSLTGQMTVTATSGTTTVEETISIKSSKAVTGGGAASAGGATAGGGATASGGTECEEFAGGDSHGTCQGPMDGEAGEIQAYVAELIATLKDEEGMKAAGLFLDPGSSNHYQVYASQFKKEWPSSARVAHLIEDNGKIKGAQIDTSDVNPPWMDLVPNSGGGGGAHTHMDGKGGYWHDPH